MNEELERCIDRLALLPLVEARKEVAAFIKGNPQQKEVLLLRLRGTFRADWVATFLEQSYAAHEAQRAAFAKVHPQVESLYHSLASFVSHFELDEPKTVTDCIILAYGIDKLKEALESVGLEQNRVYRESRKRYFKQALNLAFEQIAGLDLKEGVSWVETHQMPDDFFQDHRWTGWTKTRGVTIADRTQLKEFYEDFNKPIS